MMTGRERVLAIMNGEQPDYFPVPRHNYGSETLERW